MILLVRLRDPGKKKISAPGADIIPKRKYIRTPSADTNKLGETAAKKGGDAKTDEESQSYPRFYLWVG